MLGNLITYYHTLRHLKFVQLYGQITFRFKKIKPNTSAPPKLRKVTSQWVIPIEKESKLNSNADLVCLNQKKDVSSSKIWFDTTIDKLWLYNLHYFDYLHSDDSKENPLLLRAFRKRWITENPPPFGCGWEPYTLSLRIVNLIKWFLVANDADKEDILSLAIQVRYLSKKIESHILGNHIIANAKALIFAGLFFQGQEAERWLKKGLKIFNREIAEQILEDGGHFELSPMYHAIILEDVLDVINMFNTYQQPWPSSWLNKCNTMIYWLYAMNHLDGNISFFNDAALGVAPTAKKIKEYYSRIFSNDIQIKQESIVNLKSSGYCRIQRNNVLLITDLAKVGASYQPGHAHADTLSFELSLGCQRILVNSGTSTYHVLSDRYRQRSTQAHNTLIVNDRNSSEVWKNFRVGRRANVHDINIVESESSTHVKASHDGYYNQNKIIHTRHWIMSDNELTIKDEVSGSKSHHIKLIFHFHPDLHVVKEINKFIVKDKMNKLIGIFEIDIPAEISDSVYHPYFNVSIPNKRLVAETYQRLPIVITSSIKWNC